MSSDVFEVPPLSWAQIDDVVERLRYKYRMGGKKYFPICELLELVMCQELRQFDMEIVEFDLMRGELATTSQNGRLLKIREDVYLEANRGEGRARFTLCHELGHLVLHCTGIEVFALASGEHVPPYRHSEAQADYFAASILMPKEFFQSTDTPELVMSRHGVSYSAARNRIDYLFRKGYLKI